MADDLTATPTGGPIVKPCKWYRQGERFPCHIGGRASSGHRCIADPKRADWCWQHEGLRADEAEGELAERRAQCRRGAWCLWILLALALFAGGLIGYQLGLHNLVAALAEALRNGGR